MEKGGCRGITQIHRSPSRPRPSMRPTAAFINIHEHLIKCLVRASRQQLTSDHEPACMCHCIFFRIKPRVSKYHALCHHHATLLMSPMLHLLLKFFIYKEIQVCIPVGCTDRLLAVSPSMYCRGVSAPGGGGTCPRGCLPRGRLLLGGAVYPSMH